MTKAKVEKAPTIPVYCAYDELQPTDKLIPNPRNPNTHSDLQIALLVKIIAYQGWRNAIVVSKRSGFITKGHARLTAARILECPTVPVDLQDYDNEAEEWADMIADNRIAELAEMDRPMLKDLLEGLDDGKFDMNLTGFDAESLEMLMTECHVEGEVEENQEEKKHKNKCPKCGFEWDG